MRQVQHAQPPKLPEEYTKHLRTLAMRCLAKNPDERPSAQELIRGSPALQEAGTWVIHRPSIHHSFVLFSLSSTPPPNDE